MQALALALQTNRLLSLQTHCKHSCPCTLGSSHAKLSETTHFPIMPGSLIPQVFMRSFVWRICHILVYPADFLYILQCKVKGSHLLTPSLISAAFPTLPSSKTPLNFSHTHVNVIITFVYVCLFAAGLLKAGVMTLHFCVLVCSTSL